MTTTPPPDTSIDTLNLGIRFGRLEAGQEAIKENLQELREATNTRFDKLEKGTNDRFDKLEDKFTGLQKEVGVLQKSVWMGAGGLGLMVLLMPVVMYFLPPRQTSLALPQAPLVALEPHRKWMKPVVVVGPLGLSGSESVHGPFTGQQGGGLGLDQGGGAVAQVVS